MVQNMSTFLQYYIYLLFHPSSGELSLTDKLRECLQLSKRLMESFYCLIITLDEDGILVVRNSEPEEPFLLSKKDWVRFDLIFHRDKDFMTSDNSFE